MMFEDAKECLALAVPPHPGDPLAGLALPDLEAQGRIREGQHIGHQYYTVACHLIGIAERARRRRPWQRLAGAVNDWTGRSRLRPAYLNTQNLGDRTVDALVRLEEAVWTAHGRHADFSTEEPDWRDEAVLAQFYTSPWRLREAWDMAGEIVDPVTGESFLWPLERIFALEWRARAMAAKQVYSDLPLTARACDGLKQRAEALLEHQPEDCKALYMLLWADFAESLYWCHYDLRNHPTWEQYAEGRLAQRSLRRRTSDAAVDELARLMFGRGHVPQGLAYLKPWQTVWDHVGALISKQPFARKDWSHDEKYALADAA